MLKNSARNWARKRSPKCQFLATEKSKFLKPESGNVLRPRVPNCPNGGAIIIEAPFAEQPANVPPAVSAPALPPSTDNACAAQAAFEAPAAFGILVAPAL